MLQIRGDEARVNTEPAILLGEVLSRADEAVRFFEAEGDDEGIALSTHWASTLRFWLGQAGVAIQGFERALEHAKGRPALTSTILNFEAAALIWGPSPADEIERWAADALSACEGAPVAEAAALMARAYARALTGDATGARQLATRARSIHADMGLLAHLARTESVLGLIELLVDDLLAAERSLRQAYTVLDEGHETGFFSTVASILADVLCEQGNDEEAAATARRAIEISSADDVDPLTRSKGVLALVAARAGDAKMGVRLAEEAVEGCSHTDLLMIQADALRRLGQVLKAGGRDAAAAAAFSDALEAYERKGNSVMAAKVRNVLGLGDLPPTAATP
jgi:tetratricopeptide (TPR) repeat protein